MALKLQNIKSTSLLMVLLLLSSCMDSRQGNYYHSNVDVSSSENLIPLSKGEKPKIIFSKDIDADRARYVKLGFVVIGESSFKNREKYRAIKRARDSHVARAIGQAMKVLATHVLYFRKKVDEYMTTTKSKDGGYDTDHYETYQNHAVYMVREGAK